MAALLVTLNVMAVLLLVAMPVWKTAVKREKEAELVWRASQYARAVALFQRKYANAYPPNLDILLNERFLRKKYKDPTTKDGEFQLIYAGDQPNRPGQTPQPNQPNQPNQSDSQGRGPAGARGGIMGVVSKNTDTGLRLFNGRSKYNEWAFTPQTVLGLRAPGAGGNAPGASRPGGIGNTPPGGRPGTGGPAGPVTPGIGSPRGPQQPGQTQRPFGLPQRPPG